MKRPLPSLNPRRRGERGAVLLTVLLMVAVLSVLALSIIDEIGFGIRRAGNIESRVQAQWYALGAEQFARSLIERANKAGAAQRAALLREPMVFPIDGGVMEGRLTDGSNCFNLNSLGVRYNPDDVGDDNAAPENERFYRRLLKALDFSESEANALANALKDWLDANGTPGTQGAEDYHYAALDPPYRAANTLLAEVSELRAIRGYDEEVYRRLRPFVCALPSTAPAAININTLAEPDAPLLQMVFGDKLTAARARTVIASRPGRGYRNIQDFWDEAAFKDLNPGEAEQRLVTLKTRVYGLNVRVTYAKAHVEQSSVLELTGTGKVKLVSRRYGAVE